MQDLSAVYDKDTDTIGTGGQASVYKAKRREDGLEVAIKSWKIKQCEALQHLSNLRRVTQPNQFCQFTN